MSPPFTRESQLCFPGEVPRRHSGADPACDGGSEGASARGHHRRSAWRPTCETRPGAGTTAGPAQAFPLPRNIPQLAALLGPSRPALGAAWCPAEPPTYGHGRPPSRKRPAGRRLVLRYKHDHVHVPSLPNLIADGAEAQGCRTGRGSRHWGHRPRQAAGTSSLPPTALLRSHREESRVPLGGRQTGKASRVP